MANLQRYRLVADVPRTGLARMVDAVRSIWLGPYNTKDKELARLFGGAPASSGITVNETTALNYSAVSCAVNLVSDDVSSLPLMLYKRLPTGGKDRYEAHPLYEMLHDQPNPEMGSMVFRRTMQAHVMLWRNAYAEIERTAGGRPLALWPLVPERVSPLRDRSGMLFYRVMNPSGGSVDIAAANMIHLLGQSHDGSVGSSFVEQARESLGLALAAEKFGATFFGNGATFGGVISYKGPRPTELADKNLRETLDARHQGVERAHKLLALYNDASYTRVGIPPDDAQFLETRVFQVREVCRWFKIPPHKLADLADATFSNVEQQNIDYYTSCLRPWLTLWEQELSRKLIARLERSQQFIEHVTQALLKADAAGRSALYTAQFNVGALTPNDVRNLENQDPLVGGDRAFVRVDMIPLDRVDEWVTAQIEAKKPPPVVAAPPPPEDTKPEDTPADPEKARMVVELAEARRKAQGEEDQKDRIAAELAAIGIELGEARAAAVAGEAERARLAGELATWTATATTTEAERAAAVILVAEGATRVAALAETVATLTAARDGLGAELGAARVTIAEGEGQIATLTTTAAEAEARAAEAEGRVDVAGTAIRDVLVDGLQWLIEHEADRARRAHASPEKLRRWMDAFYPAHEDRCRKILRPSVRAYLACRGDAGPVDPVLDALVAAHLDHSIAALRDVAEANDPESLAPALEKVLRRWETTRAIAAVDAITKAA